jgi:hypothetical protein
VAIAAASPVPVAADIIGAVAVAAGITVAVAAVFTVAVAADIRVAVAAAITVAVAASKVVVRKAECKDKVSKTCSASWDGGALASMDHGTSHQSEDHTRSSSCGGQSGLVVSKRRLGRDGHVLLQKAYMIDITKGNCSSSRRKASGHSKTTQ